MRCIKFGGILGFHDDEGLTFDGFSQAAAISVKRSNILNVDLDFHKFAFFVWQSFAY